MTTMTDFETWLTRVRKAVQHLTFGQVTLEDLPDTLDLADWYSGESTPTATAKAILAEAGYPTTD